jgi:hypothetical protein
LSLTIDHTCVFLLFSYWRLAYICLDPSSLV